MDPLFLLAPKPIILQDLAHVTFDFKEYKEKQYMD